MGFLCYWGLEFAVKNVFNLKLFGVYLIYLSGRNTWRNFDSELRTTLKLDIMFEKYAEMPAAKWLRLIENENLRTKAINHTLKYPGNPNVPCTSIGEALFHAFNWDKTEEGEYYWLNVYNSKIRLKESELQIDKEKTKRADLMIAAAVVATAGIVSLWMF